MKPAKSHRAAVSHRFHHDFKAIAEESGYLYRNSITDFKVITKWLQHQPDLHGKLSTIIEGKITVNMGMHPN